MGLVPTKQTIIGRYINGRNSADDFLQLANNHGGSVFGWIDANGNLQGSLLQGLQSTPGGVNTSVQFNNSGVFGGDSQFTWDSVNKTLTVSNSGASNQPNSLNVGTPFASLSAYA